jgi:hypothetical protein
MNKWLKFNTLRTKDYHLDKKIYKDYYADDCKNGKQKINEQIYSELKSKYYITFLECGQYLPVSLRNASDIIISHGKHGYRKDMYTIIQNLPNLRDDELALICDAGNLKYGYDKINRYTFVIMHDDYWLEM